jgi:hypothetical protein
MSKQRPGLDDEQRVGQALRALAEDSARLAAPPALEARLREAFREASRTVERAGESRPAPKGASAWKWVAAVGAAAGLVWLSYASLRAPARPQRDEARLPAPVHDVAPLERPVTPVVAPPAPRVLASAPGEGSARRPRIAPPVERFEPLYPGDPLADLDAVHVVRVSVPRSTLATLGWPTRPGLGSRDRVELDAMVGPDGMTRAVRFVSH